MSSDPTGVMLGLAGLLGIGAVVLSAKERERQRRLLEQLQQLKEKKRDVVISAAPEVTNTDDAKERLPPEDKTVKPFVPGESVVLARHMYDPAEPPLEIRVSNDDLQYSLRPKYIPSRDGGPPVVYLDPQDVGFFERRVENPLLTCWIVIKQTRWTTGYVKRRLAEEFRRQNIDVRLVRPQKCDLLLSKGGLEEIVYGGEQLPLPDCAIARVGANVDYFGMAVLRQLEALGVLLFNPPPAIEIARDKLFTHQIMATNGISIPKSILGRKPIEYDLIRSHFGYPVIVKLTSGSKGEGVWKIDSEDELREWSKQMEDSTKPIIFQEFLSASKGRDLRVLVVGGKVVASMMRTAKSGFKANVHQGGSVKPVQVKPKLEKMVLKTTQLCLLDFAGVDVLLDKPGYKICEVNSSPGFEGLEKATGIDVAKTMVDHVRETVLKRREAGGRRQLDEPEVVPLQEEHSAEIEGSMKTPHLGPQPSPLAPPAIAATPRLRPVAAPFPISS